MQGVEAAERPRRGVKWGGTRRGRLPGGGRAASICLVAVARKSPRVQEAGAVARGRDRRRVIGGEAKRAGGHGDVALGATECVMCVPPCWAAACTSP